MSRKLYSGEGLYRDNMKLCCRPGCENEAISDINHRCSRCHAEYQRNWRRLSKERTIRGAYNRGIEEARDAIVAALSSWETAR